MLIRQLTSPYKLVLLLVLLFSAFFLFLSNTSTGRELGSTYLPFPLPSNTGGGKSGLEEDEQSSRIERPSEGELKIPKPEVPVTSTWSLAHDDNQGWAARPTSSGAASDSIAFTTSFPTHSPSSTLPTHAPSPTRGVASNGTLSNATAPLQELSYAQLQAKIKDLIKDWTPPTLVGHWPPYGAYYDKDYNPNFWESFAWDMGYYISNGIEKLKQHPPTKLERFNTYPVNFSPQWKKQWKGEYVACEGPRGKLLNESDEDIVKFWQAKPPDFPDAALGSASVIGIDENTCVDRYNRYGPYGYGQANAEPVRDWKRPISKPEWSSTHWQDLQGRCSAANKERYAPTPSQPSKLAPGKGMPKSTASQDSLPQIEGRASDSHIIHERQFNTQPRYHHRTALLVRTWAGYNYTENDLLNIRALITELSLLSGGEYHIFLLVNIVDNNADIWGDSKVYDDVLRQSVPRELQSISILWNEHLCEEWYPGVGDWQVKWHSYMPLQWFSETHPEFDFVWNWELSARYTGNYYQFFEGLAEFGKNRPRKYLWERNQRYYIPAAHGSYQQWLKSADVAIEKAMKENGLKPVWGPQPYNETAQEPTGPQPPIPMKADYFEWGVGEEADLITVQPIFDPTGTEWRYRNKIWNFVPGVSPNFTAEDPEDIGSALPEFNTINRRASAGTLVRFSKRQLRAMHLENLAGRTMQAEMWPATVALHHGLKAVHAPHPIWTDRKWPAWYMDAVFNADGGEAAQWSQRKDSVYNHDREHNFGGWSSYVATEFPETLYRRWLGWTSADDSPMSDVGGKNFEEGGAIMVLGLTDPDSPGGRLGTQVGGNGRMCLPPMLLYPAQNVVEVQGEFRKAA